MSKKQFILKNFKTVFEQYIEYIENNIESQKYEINIYETSYRFDDQI